MQSGTTEGARELAQAVLGSPGTVAGSHLAVKRLPRLAIAFLVSADPGRGRAAVTASVISRPRGARPLRTHPALMAYGRGQNTARTPMAAPAASATGASAVQKASPTTAALASATTASRVHIAARRIRRRRRRSRCSPAAAGPGTACYWVLCLSRSPFGVLTLKPLGKSRSDNKGSEGLDDS
jgi:hypothetical protein